MNTNTTAEPMAEETAVRSAHSQLQGATAARADRKAYMVRFGERCRIARGKISLVEAAAALGVHRNTVSNIEAGASLPDIFDLERLAQVYGTTTRALTGEQERPSASDGVAHATQAIEIGNYVYVPLFDIKVSTDHSMFSNVAEVLEMRPFPLNYIRRELGIDHNEIALVTVIGPSMEPELHSRDVALLDRRDRDVQSEGAHAIRLDNTLLVKRLQRLPNRRLRVISTNPAYDPFEVHGSDDQNFEVLGRVRGGLVIFN